MFPVPVEVWGSAPPASQLRLKEARREHLYRSHGISRYSDIIQQDLYRWREVNNSPKFSSLPNALEEEERERELNKSLQGSRRRVVSGNGLSTRAKLKDIWKKIIPTIIGKSKSHKFPSESHLPEPEQDLSGSSGSPSLREPEKSILNRIAQGDRRNDAPKKVVRWADESEEDKSPRALNLSTIDEESGLLHRQVGELAFVEAEEPDPFLELDDDDPRLRSDQIDRRLLRHPDTWPPHPGLMCANALSSYSDSELTRHATAGCPCCDERQAILANLRSPDTAVRSPDAGFHSPESAASQSCRTAAECAASACALSAAAQAAACGAASLPSSSGASSFNNPSSDSPSSFLPVKLPRLASTPSLLPSQLELITGDPFVVPCSGVRHRAVAFASVRYSNSSHAAAHP